MSRKGTTEEAWGSMVDSVIDLTIVVVESAVKTGLRLVDRFKR